MKTQEQTSKHVFQNGFIYSGVDTLIGLLKWLNIIELIKLVVWKNSRNEIKGKRNCNIAIDLFILAKYSFVISLWLIHCNNYIATLAIEYLLASNIFVYFYYHVWKVRIADLDHAKRRFISLITSVAFMVICYGYLYQVPFHEHFQWIVINKYECFASLRLSISNSFTLSSEVIPKSVVGQALVLSQQISSFIFLAIILSQSIPSEDKK